MPFNKDEQPTPLWDDEKPRSRAVPVQRSEFNTAGNRRALDRGKQRGIVPQSHGTIGTTLVRVD